MPNRETHRAHAWFPAFAGLVLALGFSTANLVGDPVSAHAATTVPAAQLQVYYAPETDLEPIDIELIGRAGSGGTINLAGFVLSDYRIIDALGAAASRGAHVRIYLDPGELKHLRLSPRHPLVRLAAEPGVEIRVKADGELMHLKGYCIDATILRTGSANMSLSGLKRQDNDLVYIASSTMAAAFNRHFEMMWQRSGNQPLAAFTQGN